MLLIFLLCNKILLYAVVKITEICYNNKVLKSLGVFMITVKTSNAEETEQLGVSIARVLKGKEVIAYFGGLGMGKTTLTRGIARGLGIGNEVSSPTFAIVNEYKAKFSIYHFDMYRVTGWDDLYSTGFFDYLEAGVMIIEWSENIENALPDNTVRITISKGEKDDERIFEIEGLQL